MEVHAELLERARDGTGAFEFVGNVEGGDVVEGVADVIVTDGFTGNIALKLMEGVSQTMLGAVSDAAMSSTRAKLGGALLRPALQGISRGDRSRSCTAAPICSGLRRPGRRPARALSRAPASHRRSVRAERGAREDIVGQTQRALGEAGALQEGARVRAGR